MVGFQHREACGNDCPRVCCTKIEGFGISAGDSRILHNIDLHIHCGELTAIIGVNGAGKSTLLKAILGEVRHMGSLHYLDAKGDRSGHPLIGYVPQQLTFDAGIPASVFDLFMTCLLSVPVWLYKPKGFEERVRMCLQRVKAEHLLHRRLNALSGGELQRVFLALALEPIPDLLLLDEPVSGIDRNGTEMFYDIVSELRKNYDLSIILVSHDLNMVEKYADRVVLLHQGTVVCNGAPSQVFSHPGAREIFGGLLPSAGV